MSKPKFKKLLVLLSLLPVTVLPLTSISLRTDKQNKNEIQSELVTSTRATRAEPQWITDAKKKLGDMLKDQFGIFWQWQDSDYWIKEIAKIDGNSTYTSAPEKTFTFYFKRFVESLGIPTPDNQYTFINFRGFLGTTSSSRKVYEMKAQEIFDANTMAKPTYSWILSNTLETSSDIDRYFKDFEELVNNCKIIKYVSDAVSRIFHFWKYDYSNLKWSYKYIGSTKTKQHSIDWRHDAAKDYLEKAQSDHWDAVVPFITATDIEINKLYPHSMEHDVDIIKNDLTTLNTDNKIFELSEDPELETWFNELMSYTPELSTIQDYKKKYFQFFYKYLKNIYTGAVNTIEPVYITSKKLDDLMSNLNSNISPLTYEQDGWGSKQTNYSMEAIRPSYVPDGIVTYMIDAITKWHTLNSSMKILNDELTLNLNYYSDYKFNETSYYGIANTSLKQEYDLAFNNSQKIYHNSNLDSEVILQAAESLKAIRTKIATLGEIDVARALVAKIDTIPWINSNKKTEYKNLIWDGTSILYKDNWINVCADIQQDFAKSLGMAPIDDYIIRFENYEFLNDSQKIKIQEKANSLITQPIDPFLSTWDSRLQYHVYEYQDRSYIAAVMHFLYQEVYYDINEFRNKKLNYLYANVIDKSNFDVEWQKVLEISTINYTELKNIQDSLYPKIKEKKDALQGIYKVREMLIESTNKIKWEDQTWKETIIRDIIGDLGYDEPNDWTSMMTYWEDYAVHSRIDKLYIHITNSFKENIKKKSNFVNLIEAQKDKLIASIPASVTNNVEANLNNIAYLNDLYDEAGKLDSAMLDLKNERNLYPTVITTTDYKYAYPSLKKAYDDAYNAASFTDYKDRAAVIKLLNDLKTAKANLNGDDLELGTEKDKLRAEINASQDLLDNEKTELLQDVDNATDIPQLMAVREKFENKVTANKQIVIDTKALFNDFINAVNWEETTVTDEWKNVVTTIINIRNLESVKTSLWDTIKASMQTSLVNLVNLNDAQRQVYIAKIPQTLDSSSKNFATEYTNAKALDASMLALSEEKANYPTVIATDNYIKADQAKKEAYDQAYANSTFTDAKDKVAVDALKNALISTKNALNGDANILKAAKDALTKEIQDHPYLEPSQKAILLPKVAAATKLADLDPIRQEMEDYIKSNLDIIKQALKQQINDSKWTTPSEKTSLISKADAMTSTTILQTVEEVTNDLKVMLQTHLQTLANLNQAQKDVLKTEAGSLTKIIELFTQYDKAIQLDGTMKTLKDLIESLRDVFNEPNYKEAEEAKKQSFMQAYQALTFIDGKTNDEVLTLIQNANDAKNNLDGLARVQAEKDKLRTEITNDLYLTSDQKLMLGDEVNKANTMAEVWTVKNLKDKLSLENKQKLNAKKEALKAKVNALEIIEASAKPAIITAIDDATITTIDFVELDINGKIKNAFDLLIDSQLNLNQAQKDLLKSEALPENAASTLNDLVTKIKELEKAMKDLADIKYAYKDVKTSALYTEDEQERKEAFDRAYDALTFTDAKTKQEVETLIENVKAAKNALKGVSTLDQAKKDLKTEIENNPKLNPSQKSYFKGKVDAASSFADLDAIRKEISDLEDLDASKAKLITLINQTKWPENSKKQELIKKVEAATSQNFNVIKDEVTGELLSILKTFVQGLTNLNSSQTQHFKDQLKTFGEVKTMNQIFIESEALDKEMKIVNDLINDYKDVTTLSIYLDDIQAKKDRFDIAYLNLKFSENKNREEVIAIIKEAREAKEALNGKLNNEQESLEDLQKQIARATAEAETLIEKTQPLHNNLDIKASVEKLNQLILDGKDPNKINIDLVNSMKSEITKLNELGTGEFNKRIDEKQYLTQVQKDWTKKQYLVAKHSIDVNTVLNNAHELDNLMKILKSEFESLLTKEEYAKTLPGYSEVKQKSKQLLALDGEKDLQQDDDLNDIKDLIPRVKDLNKKASDAMPVPSKQDKISASLRNSAKAGLALNILLFLGLAAIVSMLLTVFKKFR